MRTKCETNYVCIQAFLQPYSIVYHLIVGVVATLVTLFVWTRENRHLYDMAVSKFRSSR